ncbi:MAG: hypothetical protein JO110_01045 [Acetobacteraceae bacterium]|nr:hypothetical protein [Acetobacteraceae bacterium]
MLSLSNDEGVRLATKASPPKLQGMFVRSALVAFFSFGLMSSPAQADSNCRRLAGPYLVTVTDNSGNLVVRQVLTLSNDGNAFLIDSGQGGVPNSFNPFTSAQGFWSCQFGFPTSATATVLDFSLPGTVPGDQHIGRTDYQIRFAPGSGAISGTLELRFFPLTGDPLVVPLPTPPASSFTFTGEAVKGSVQR